MLIIFDFPISVKNVYIRFLSTTPNIFLIPKTVFTLLLNYFGWNYVNFLKIVVLHRIV